MQADCILWQKAIRSNGYGAAVLDGKCTTAHRVVYTETFGPIPKGMCVCHRCDNPRCVNPNHLFLGTHKDNIRDMHAKGRARNGHRQLGTEHPQSIFTETQVRRMRQLHSAGLTIKSINQRFGGNYSTVQRIITRQTWKHLTQRN